MDHLLVVDADPRHCEIISSHFKRLGFEVNTASGIAEAIRLCAAVRPDVAIIDCKLSDGDGLDLISRLKKSDSGMCIFALAGRGTIELAVRAIKEGAEQFLIKPVELPVLADQVAKAVEIQRGRRQQTANALNRARYRRDPFLGISSAIRRLADEVQKVVHSDFPVLIEGETGTGKGVLAEWLHQNGPRRNEAFVDINCAGLSKELLESELFGHDRGSFTGAVAVKPGLLEIAHRGTAFLDEIGDMDLAIQPKLLKVVEEKTFRHVGGIQDRALNIRLIAASHNDLSLMIREKSFRSDLYFRINTIPVHIPPLRRRPEDIRIMAQFFVHRLRTDLGFASLTLSPAALNSLTGYWWPGNIRELRNVLERAALLVGNKVIETEHLYFQRGSTPSAATNDLWSLPLNKLEALHIEQVLQRTGWSVGAAAVELGIAKSTLYSKLRGYNLSPDKTNATGQNQKFYVS